MRRERRATSEDAETYTFHFQITNNGGRQACSVKVQAPSIHDATTFFRQNWPTIVSMARVAARSDGAGGEKSVGVVGAALLVFGSKGAAEQEPVATIRRAVLVPPGGG